jgi:hypothetical protein
MTQSTHSAAEQATQFVGAWRATDYVYRPDDSFAGTMTQIRVLQKNDQGMTRVTQRTKPDDMLAQHPLANFAGEWAFELSIEGRARRYFGPDTIGTGLTWGDGVITGRGFWAKLGYSYDTTSILINPGNKLAPQRQITHTQYRRGGELIATVLGVAEQDEMSSPEELHEVSGYFPALTPPYVPTDIWHKWRGTLRTCAAFGAVLKEEPYVREYVQPPTESAWVWGETGGHEVTIAKTASGLQVSGYIRGIARQTGWSLQLEAHDPNGESLEHLEILDVATSNLVGIRRWLKDNMLVELQFFRLVPVRK